MYEKVKVVGLVKSADLAKELESQQDHVFGGDEADNIANKFWEYDLTIEDGYSTANAMCVMERPHVCLST